MSVLPEIQRWQLGVFPHATTASVMAHLRREMAELEAAPTDLEEMADMVHLLCALAQAAGGDLEEATRAKFALNQARQWQEPDAEGVVEHVR